MKLDSFEYVVAQRHIKGTLCLEKLLLEIYEARDEAGEGGPVM